MVEAICPQPGLRTFKKKAFQPAFTSDSPESNPNPRRESSSSLDWPQAQAVLKRFGVFFVAVLQGR